MAVLIFFSTFHKKLAHKNAKNMMHALSHAELFTTEMRKLVEKVVESCMECKIFWEIPDEAKDDVTKGFKY